MLSLHTNVAALSAQSTLSRTSKALSASQAHLATGYRVNSAMDDAAGLQIATRLKSQSSGMAVAMRNTQNGMSMLQVADGLMDEVTNILIRVKDLATQAADDSSTPGDRDAMHAEYVTQSEEVFKIINETTYNGEPLIRYTVSDPGQMGTGPVTFQTGESKSEKITIDFRPLLGQLNGSLYFALDNGHLFGYPVDDPNTELTSADHARIVMDKATDALKDVSALRAQFGALGNRLQSAFNNLSNIKANTEAARGRIVDADYATETANATSEQMLAQAGISMLKQSNSMPQLVMALVA
jgi:flagellin